MHIRVTHEIPRFAKETQEVTLAFASYMPRLILSADENPRSPKFDKTPAVHTHEILQPYRYLSTPSAPKQVDRPR